METGLIHEYELVDETDKHRCGRHKGNQAVAREVVDTIRLVCVKNIYESLPIYAYYCETCMEWMERNAAALQKRVDHAMWRNELENDIATTMGLSVEDALPILQGRVPSWLIDDSEQIIVDRYDLTNISDGELDVLAARHAA